LGLFGSKRPLCGNFSATQLSATLSVSIVRASKRP
jgi:hypothetical protein